MSKKPNQSQPTQPELHELEQRFDRIVADRYRLLLEVVDQLSKENTSLRSRNAELKSLMTTSSDLREIAGELAVLRGHANVIANLRRKADAIDAYHGVKPI